MRSLILLMLLLNVWSALGQTFNKRYDFDGQLRAQSAGDIEFAAGGSLTIVQLTSALDTVAPGLYFTHPAIGLTRIDGDTGNKLWDKRFSPVGYGAGPGWANCCDTIPGGGIVIGGAKQDTLQQLSALLMVFDAQGDTVFTRDISPPGSQWNGFSVKHTQDDGFIVVGQTDATGYLDGFAIKTDALGNVEWRRTYGLPAPRTDAFLSVLEAPNGDLILGGAKYPTNTTQRRWIQRIDADGNFLWEVLWPTIDPGASAQLSLMANGDILMASNWSYAADFQQQRFQLARLEPMNGATIWDRQYGETANFQTFFAAKEVPNGDLIACGVSEVPIGYHGVLLRTNSEGDSLWMRKYVYQDSVINDGAGQFYDVLPTPDGGFIATGPVYGRLNAPNPPGYSQDAWVVKVDGEGCLVPGCNSVGVAEQVTNLLGALTLFPNPVVSGQAITLQLDLPPSVANEALQLSVVATDGRVVHQQGLTGNGSHILALQDLAAGVYYVHVAAGGKWLTGGKFVVE